MADTKKYAIRRGDHRSPENRIHFVGNGTPSPSCHPSDGSAVSSPQGKPIVSVADTKKYAIRRGDHRSPFFVWCCRDDHRSPENRIHFVGNGTTTSFLPPLRHFVPPLLKERLLRRPLRGAAVKRLRGSEQQFNIKKSRHSLTAFFEFFFCFFLFFLHFK